MLLPGIDHNPNMLLLKFYRKKRKDSVGGKEKSDKAKLKSFLSRVVA